MATTRFITRHTNKSQTVEQAMKDSFNYALNPEKTRNGELVSAYMCDPKTAADEFILSKAKYKAITGREQKRDADIIFYQIRQSFVPGEINYDEALKIGYETAMRWTKGRHAFFVVSHTDKPHPHVHIYYNSTSIDYTKKHRDFLGSAKALRRLSDRICIENGLSYIANPKLKSKSKFKHYGAWLGDKKVLTFKDRLKAQIDICLNENPVSFDEFLQSIAAAGYEVKHGRGGVISLRIEGQERYTRLRSSTLGKGYGQEDIQAIIEGRVSHSGERVEATRKVNLVIDIQAKIKAGKGLAYQRWATVFNLKQMAAAVQYLQENNLWDYIDLDKKATETTDLFHALSDKIKTTETAIKRNNELRVAVADYAKTRPVFEEYKKKKYNKKYFTEHEDDIAKYREAQAIFKRVFAGAKLPKMDVLKAEAGRLAVDKKSAYTEYRNIRKNMQEVVSVKANIDRLFNLTDKQKNKEMEH